MCIDEEELESEMRWRIDHVRGGYSKEFTSEFISPHKIIEYLKLHDGIVEIVDEPNGWQCDMSYHIVMPDNTVYVISSSAYYCETTFTKETDKQQIEHVIKCSARHRT